MDQWWLAILPIALAGLGYLGKRRIERSDRVEAVKRRLAALSLLRGLRQERVTIAELDEVEREATDR